jgi:hypothetical protein
MTELEVLYKIDYSAWAQRHVESLRAERYSDLDVEHLLKELSDMGESEQRRSKTDWRSFWRICCPSPNTRR